ncbi:MAG: serine hydrolase [Bacteroidales bacterium]|nr:serine hydrolase [Bacteroidales bacterium]
MRRTALIFATIAVAMLSTASAPFQLNRIHHPKIGVNLNREISNALSDIPELGGMDRKVRAFMDRWALQGACLAVVRNDSLVFAKGYGWADREKEIRMEPNMLMRVASVSKLITAVGIMNLVDREYISLQDKVFGEEGLLVGPLYDRTVGNSDYSAITVEHLLRHQGGFVNDPMFEPKMVRSFLGVQGSLTADDYIRYELAHRLRYCPGTVNRYSNFGYLLLSRIIESVMEEDYESFIDRNILEPLGIMDMHIAQNLYMDRYPGEVRYYSHDVSRNSYGDNDITVLSGAGAWCCSIVELAKLVAAIDGRPEVEDIISPESVALMTAYDDPAMFALGWNDTNPQVGWTRTGTFTGTSALIKYFPDGECWIFITNTSTWKGPQLASYTGEMFRQCRELYSSRLPRRNLFYY